MAVVITPLEFGRDEFDVPDRCLIESNHLRREAINRAMSCDRCGNAKPAADRGQRARYSDDGCLDSQG